MTTPQLIVAVDDQPEVLAALREILAARGRRVEAFERPGEALAFLAGRADDVALCVLDLDLGPGECDGVELCARVRRAHPELPVILLSGKGGIDEAVRAVRAGASDFIEKDPDLGDKLELGLEKVERLLAAERERRRLEGENRQLRAEAGRHRERAERRARIVGDSPAIRAVLEKIARVAAVPRPVLILGERGTGKELVAQAIHRASTRAGGPFVTINCAAVTESLLESELFGHEPGAFTGANRRKEGRFEQAHGGTLFLDEIGDMSPEFQAKILRVLEYPRFERVAGTRTIEVDVRVVAATNVDLREAIAGGAFRADLYDRLAFETVTLPPLRDRREDVPALARHLLALFLDDVPAARCRGIGAGAAARLAQHLFPGNVRELRNVVERAAYAAAGPELSAEEVERALPPVTSPAAAPPSFAAAPSSASPRSPSAAERPAAPAAAAAPLATRIAELERTAVTEALARAGGRQRDAAVTLGLTYDQLRHLIRKHGLRRER